MTRDQMLDAMGISQDDFVDFLLKYQAFQASLSPTQRSITNNALPTLSQIAASFGPDCSIEDVEDLLRLIPEIEGVLAICWMGCIISNP